MPFTWTDEAQESFEKLKRALLDAELWLIRILTFRASLTLMLLMSPSVLFLARLLMALNAP